MSESGGGSDERGWFGDKPSANEVRAFEIGSKIREVKRKILQEDPFPETETAKQWREKLANASENVWSEAQKETDAKIARLGLTEAQVGRREEFVIDENNPANTRLIESTAGNMEGYKLFDRELKPGETPPVSAESRDYRSRNQQIEDLKNSLEFAHPELGLSETVARLVGIFGSGVTHTAETYLRSRNSEEKGKLTSAIGNLYDYLGVLELKIHPDRQLPMADRPQVETLPEGAEATLVLDDFIQAQRHVSQIGAEIATAEPRRKGELRNELKRASRERDRIGRNVQRWILKKENERKWEGELPLSIFEKSDVDKQFPWERPEAVNYQLVKATNVASGREGHFLYYWKGEDKRQVYIEPVDRIGESLGEAEEIAQAVSWDEADKAINQHEAGLRPLGWHVKGSLPLPGNGEEYRQTLREMMKEEKAGRGIEVAPETRQMMEELAAEPTLEENIKATYEEARAEIEDIWQWVKSGEIVKSLGAIRKGIVEELSKKTQALAERFKGKADKSGKSALSLLNHLRRRVDSMQNGPDGGAAVNEVSNKKPEEV